MPQIDIQPRILMLGWEDPNKIHGGLGVASSALAQALSSLTDVSFWFPSSIPDEAQSRGRYIENRVPIDMAPYAGGAYGAELARALQLYHRLVVQQGLSWDPDIVHAHDWMTFPAAGEIAESLDVPLVYHVHSLSTDRQQKPEGLAYDTESDWLKKADLILAVSEYTAQELIDHFDVDPDRVQVLQHGQPEVTPYRTKKPFAEKLVLFLGRMTWQKGPLHFLNMAKELLRQRSDVRFVMAGDGDQWPDLVKDVARNGLGTSVFLPGHCSRKEVFDLLSMADLLVMTSESEPMGLVAVEAAHFKVPVVLPRRCGAREILPHAPVAEPSDTPTLAKLVSDLLDHPKKRSTITKQNLKALQHVSWEDTARRLLRQYWTMLT